MKHGAPAVKVPVGEVAIAAYRSVFSRFGLTLELGWLPLLIFLAGTLLPDLAMRYLVPEAIAAPTDTAPVFGIVDFGNIGELVIGVLALSAFAVRWYQLMLLADPRALPFRLALRAWLRFAGYGLTIFALWVGLYAGLAWSAIAQTEGIAGAVVIEAAAVAALFIAVTRVSLVFPAAAYGAPLGLGEAWQAMGGNVWRLVGANVLVTLPIVLTMSLMVAAAFEAAGVDPGDPAAVAAQPFGLILVQGVAQAMTGFVMTALGASLMSDFYRRVVLPRDRGE